jgi:hypothetical protein
MKHRKIIISLDNTFNQIKKYERRQYNLSIKKKILYSEILNFFLMLVNDKRHFQILHYDIEMMDLSFEVFM